jgi:hypothetical protein
VAGSAELRANLPPVELLANLRTKEEDFANLELSPGGPSGRAAADDRSIRSPDGYEEPESRRHSTVKSPLRGARSSGHIKPGSLFGRALELA